MEKAGVLIGELFSKRRAWKLADIEIELALGGLAYGSKRDLSCDLRKLGYVSSSDGRVNMWHLPGEKVALSKNVGAGELVAVLDKLTAGRTDVGMAELAAHVRTVFGERSIPDNMTYRLMERRGWRPDKTDPTIRKWVKLYAI